MLNRLEKAKGGEKGGRRPLSTCVSLCNKVSVHHSKFDPCIPGKVGGVRTMYVKAVVWGSYTVSHILSIVNASLCHREERVGNTFTGFPV